MVMGGILESAGIPGFLGNLDVAKKRSSPEDAALITFIGAWWAKYADDGRMMGNPDIVDAFGKSDSLVSLMTDNGIDLPVAGFDGEARAKSLGHYLAKFEDNVFAIGGGVDVCLTSETMKNKKVWSLTQIVDCPWLSAADYIAATCFASDMEEGDFADGDWHRHPAISTSRWERVPGAFFMRPYVQPVT